MMVTALDFKAFYQRVELFKAGLVSLLILLGRENSTAARFWIIFTCILEPVFQQTWARRPRELGRKLELQAHTCLFLCSASRRKLESGESTSCSKTIPNQSYPMRSFRLQDNEIWQIGKNHCTIQSGRNPVAKTVSIGFLIMVLASSNMKEE